MIERVRVGGCDRMGIYVAEGAQTTIRDSAITGNSGAGVFLSSGEATLERVVVRDTRFLEERSGYGIRAEDDAGATVRDSLFHSNQNSGLSFVDSDLRLERSVVKDTQPQQDDKTLGVGVASLASKRVAELIVLDCLVARNRGAGIASDGTKLTLERSIIRDTESQASDQQSGIGLQVSRREGLAAPTFSIRHSLLARNRTIGVHIYEVQGSIEGTVIEDTREQEVDRQYGLGLKAQLSQVELSNCVLAGNRLAGIAVLSSKASLNRSVVRNTTADSATGDFGFGVLSFEEPTHPTELKISEVLVAHNQMVGVWLWSSRNTVERSVIRDTRVTTKSAEFGDGIQLGVEHAGGASTLTLTDTLVEKSARAGLLISGSGGFVRRSTFRRGIFAIDLEQGASASIGEDNVYEDNQENRVSIGAGLQVAPAPVLPSL